MTSWLFIMEKMGTFLNETIHITLEGVVYFKDHQNKVVPLMKPSIFVNFNGIKFHSCISWLTDDTQSHCFSHRVNNDHIDNKNLVFMNHVEIDS